VINYEVTVVTGDKHAAGTNANVFCQIYGDEGKTEVLVLKSRSNNFERATTEIFRVCITSGVVSMHVGDRQSSFDPSYHTYNPD